MATDYLPKDSQSMCEWLENWKIEFAAVATSLGFSGLEITNVLTDANWALYACRSSADAGSFASAWIDYRDGLLYGDPNSPVGATPATATPTAPAVPAPGRGIVTRIRATVKRVKGAPAYTQSIGQALRIVPTGGPVDPVTAKPAARAKPLPMFQAQVRWNKQIFPGVLVQSQRASESAWTDLGVKTGKAFVNERAPLEAGKPEVRHYRMIYVKDDATVQP